MKLLLAPLLCLSALPAFAAGPYDGVYQYGLSPAFYSVHQNGNTLLVVSLTQLSLSGVEISLGNYRVSPSALGNWEYSIGTINGNRARISGTGLYGACQSTTDVTIDDGTVTATLVSAVNTPFGTSQSVNCQQLFRDLEAIGATTITLRRIF